MSSHRHVKRIRDQRLSATARASADKVGLIILGIGVALGIIIGAIMGGGTGATIGGILGGGAGWYLALQINPT